MEANASRPYALKAGDGLATDRPYHFRPPAPSYPIRSRTGSSPSNNRSGTLSIRLSRSTNTSSGPLTMTSPWTGSRGRVQHRGDAKAQATEPLERSSRCPRRPSACR